MSEADHFRDERFRQMLEKFLNAIVIVHGFSFAEAQRKQARRGAVAGLVEIECGVVSGVINLESSGVEAPDWRPRHDKQYHAA